MKQPEGFTARGQGSKVMRLLRALYGPKQATLQWWRELEAFMKTMGFHQASSNARVFIYKHPVRATPSKIPKWVLCGLYKNSGSGEMRLMG